MPALRLDAVGAVSLCRAVAEGGSAVALKRDTYRKPRKEVAETRHKAEIRGENRADSR